MSIYITELTQPPSSDLNPFEVSDAMETQQSIRRYLVNLGSCILTSESEYKADLTVWSSSFVSIEQWKLTLLISKDLQFLFGRLIAGIIFETNQWDQ